MIRFTGQVPQRFLTRQIHEAVRLQRWGESVALNSKCEFNRCKIGRLTLGDHPEDTFQGEIIRKDGQEEGSKDVRNWEDERLMTRRAQEVRNNLSMERGIVRSPSHKRLGEEDLTKKKRTKKRVYPLMEEDWGSTTLEEDMLEKSPSFQPPTQPPPTSTNLHHPQPTTQEAEPPIPPPTHQPPEDNSPNQEP